MQFMCHFTQQWHYSCTAFFLLLFYSFVYLYFNLESSKENSLYVLTDNKRSLSLIIPRRGHSEVKGWAMSGGEKGVYQGTEARECSELFWETHWWVMERACENRQWGGGGGAFVVKHERVATYHCAFSHQPPLPHPLHRPHPSTGVLFKPGPLRA